jgi:hypothetical protein
MFSRIARAKRQEVSRPGIRRRYRANQTSDTYVLLTVLFAAVLFFGGIAGMADSRRLRIIILTIALALFVVTVAFLATMPICNK